MVGAQPKALVPRAEAAPHRVRPTGARARRDRRMALLFLSPVLLSLLALRLLPAVSAVRTSTLQGLPGSARAPRFVGWDNFAALFESGSFWNSVRRTLLFSVLVNPIQIGIALALAFLLTRRVPAAGLWRTLIFLPSAVPLLGSTIIWGIALRPNGPINGVIEALGGSPRRFLTSPDEVLWAIILMASWIGIGYWMMFLIAGLNDIPISYYEAARIDGAHAVRQFVSITLPLLQRPLLFVLVADTVANFLLFAPIQVLTNGGPREASNLLMYDVYHNQFQLGDPYTAAAELVILLVIMFGVVGLQFRLLRGAE